MTLFEAEHAGAPPSSVAPVPAPPSNTVRLKVLVAYDGSSFHGFAHNPGVATVAGALRDALAKVLGHEVELTCAGRTDAGVHAWGQVVHFDVDEGTKAAEDPISLQRSLNRMLAPRIVVRELDVTLPGFDARRWATGRRYRYLVLNRPLPDPFLAATSWHVAEVLDVRAMQLACDPLIGEHDWSSFCRKAPLPAAVGAVAPSLVRIVRRARWLELGEGMLRFDIEASAFCHQMVRSLVGTLVAVGRGRLRAGDLGGILRSRDRSLAAQPAPPNGLCLWEALYGPGPRENA
ncbi:MAG: tRNA pseudouridine(38-40) synthase TruA [Acidimicrobiales bacterium]